MEVFARTNGASPADSRVRALLLEVPEQPTAEQIQAALRRALGDPTLLFFAWDPAAGTYLDAHANEPPAATNGTRRVTTYVGYDDRPLAALVHDAAVLDAPDVLEAVVGAARLGLAKDRLQKELEAKIEELKASRSRLVEAGHAERRRLERDLHDGAQQRLVSLALALRLAETRLGSDTAAAGELLSRAQEELKLALDELRELARGIHPAVLTEQGVVAALEGVASRAAVPVEISVELEGRLPERVEVAAYYVACEALTNAVKHSHAALVRVAIRRRDGSAVVEVRDDGSGGADADGSGLRGLADRVEALGGRLEVTSRSGAGTSVCAVIPCS